MNSPRLEPPFPAVDLPLSVRFTLCFRSPLFGELTLAEGNYGDKHSFCFKGCKMTVTGEAMDPNALQGEVAFSTSDIYRHVLTGIFTRA